MAKKSKLMGKIFVYLTLLGLLSSPVVTQTITNPAIFFPDPNRVSAIISLPDYQDFKTCMTAPTAGTDRTITVRVTYPDKFVDTTTQIQVAVILYDFSVVAASDLKFDAYPINDATMDSYGFNLFVNCYDVNIFNDLKYMYFSTNYYQGFDFITYRQMFKSPVTTSPISFNVAFVDDITSDHQRDEIYTVSGLWLSSTVKPNTDTATKSTKPYAWDFYWTSQRLAKAYRSMNLQFQSTSANTVINMVNGFIIEWDYYTINSSPPNSSPYVPLTWPSIQRALSTVAQIPYNIYTSSNNGIPTFIGFIGFEIQKYVQSTTIVPDPVTKVYSTNAYLGLGITAVYENPATAPNKKSVKFNQNSDNLL